MRKLHSIQVALFISILFSTLLLSCKGEEAGLENPTEDELAELNNAVIEISADTTTNLIQGSAAKGDTWESWENAFFSCFRDETFRKNKVYLGPSNLKYLGTILSKDKNSTRTDLISIVPPAELATFIIRGGPVSNCDLTKVKDFSINFFLDAALPQMTDSLGAAVTKYDSVKVTAGQWQIDEIKIDDFLNYLNQNSNNPKIASYKNSLLNKKNFVITKLVKVNGFKADVYTNKSFSAGVQAELQASKILNIATPDSANNQLSTKLTLTSNKKGIVNVSSSGEFYIFGMVQKGKKL
jgi:hypothetical protein